MASIDQLAKTIAGETTLSQKPGQTLKKWREIFGANQIQISKKLGISPSVVSDYESGRRENPGAKFIKTYIQALLNIDKEKGGQVANKFSPTEKNPAIIDIQEYLNPIPAKKFIKTIKGETLTGKKQLKDATIEGYTIIDSLKAILDLTEKEFVGIYGANTNRALIFTKVNLGRSPLVAVKVTKPKPSLIILHGLKPQKVDKLAIHIAESIKVPLIVSKIETTSELTEKLREKTK
ncbi:MAG TPA: helix-turn-helix domain-containing protein [Candidatus Altiarchaeales archaeon]|nr:helix-turn-helix domain-containing protein [Candidatus Altiarchaeales archaeon]